MSNSRLKVIQIALITISHSRQILQVCFSDQMKQPPASDSRFSKHQLLASSSNSRLPVMTIVLVTIRLLEVLKARIQSFPALVSGPGAASVCERRLADDNVTVFESDS
jgi:hypothetical protein